jgi:flagellar L-ring protein precursor FlgH
MNTSEMQHTSSPGKYRQTRRTTIAALFVLALVSNTVLGQSMFADYRAARTGDILTVVLAERTSAQRASGWKNQSDSKLGGSANLGNGGGLDGTFGLDAKFNNNASAKNESVQSDLLRGTMTAMVDSTDIGGNLIISGERTLSVNGEVHTMKLSGLVRRTDVQPSNTIMSFQIAQANIEYERKGGMKRSLFKPGRVARFGAVAVLIAGFLVAK